MTNFEKYHQEMIENGYTAVKNGKPASCGIISCEECYCFEEGDCNNIALLEWLAEEYEEPKPTLTEREMYFCKAFETGYLVRGSSVGIIYSAKKPVKTGVIWKNENPYSSFFQLPKTLQDEFKFILYKDEEPHSIEEMLTWEIKDE